MTYSIATEIICDVKDCLNTITPAYGKGARKYTATKIAERKGWIYLGNDKHQCPEHTTKSKGGQS